MSSPNVAVETIDFDKFINRGLLIGASRNTKNPRKCYVISDPYSTLYEKEEIDVAAIVKENTNTLSYPYDERHLVGTFNENNLVIIRLSGSTTQIRSIKNSGQHTFLKVEGNFSLPASLHVYRHQSTKSSEGSKILELLENPLYAIGKFLVSSLVDEDFFRPPVKLIGSNGKNNLKGNANDNMIFGGGGKDALFGKAGNDYLNGGTGHDKLLGGSGDDKIDGSSGNDRLKGDAGNDKLSGGIGRDKLSGNAGDDELYGGANNDKLYGGIGHDTLDGGSGHDILNGHAGKDVLDGGAGHDTLNGSTGDDKLDGGTGDDWLYGSVGHDTLNGYNGNDTLEGGVGNDRLEGGAGNNTYYFTAYGSIGHDTIHLDSYSKGVDTIVFESKKQHFVIKWDDRRQEAQFYLFTNEKNKSTSNYTGKNHITVKGVSRTRELFITNGWGASSVALKPYKVVYMVEGQKKARNFQMLLPEGTKEVWLPANCDLIDLYGPGNRRIYGAVSKTFFDKTKIGSLDAFFGVN